MARQWSLFLIELTRTLPVVIVHNGIGLLLGWLGSLAAGLPVADRRAVVIEGGMQNSGLALGIIAAQFSSDLAMVAVAGLCSSVVPALFFNCTVKACRPDCAVEEPCLQPPRLWSQLE